MVTALEILATRAGPASVLKPRERELPPPAPSQVQLRVEAVGVAYADIVLRRGLYPAAKPPVAPGYDVVGVVEALGAEVFDLAVGQRVAGITVHGAYASYCNVEARWLVRAPDAPPAETLVAAVLNGVTAWQMLMRIASADAGDWVLVHGAAGGVGGLLLDFARLARVQAVGTASAGKRDAVLKKGGVFVDYQHEDILDAARRLSDGGVVAAFDHIGGDHFRKVSMAALRSGGIGVLYGGYEATRGGKVRPLEALKLFRTGGAAPFHLFNASQGVVGYSVPAWREARPHAYRRDLAHVLDLVAQGVVRPEVGAVYALRDAVKAHEALERRSVSGKIVLVP